MVKREVILVVGLVLFLTAVSVAYGIDGNSSNYLNLSDSGSNITESNNTLFEKLNYSLIINNSLIFIDKDDYYIGEKVLIYFKGNITENYTISIKTSSSIYSLVGQIKSPTEFLPSAPGLYQITAQNNVTGADITYNFTVKPIEEFKDKISIYTDKKTYFLGEFVNIYLNFTKKDNYTFYITSQNNIYQFLGDLGDKLTFKPEHTGMYTVKIEESGKVLASYSFEVIEKEQELEPFYLSNEFFYLGDIANIHININLSSIEILFGQESYKFFNVTKDISFIPNKAGNYQVNAVVDNETFSKTFVVAEKEKLYDYYFNLDEDVVIDFDLKPIAEDKRTILNIIFGTSPIDKLVFYVENHGDDEIFNLSVEQLSKEYFRVSIKSNPKIEPGIYTLIAEIIINDDVINETKTFNWSYLDIRGPYNETPGQIIEYNESLDKELEIINQYTDYIFNLDEDVIIEIDFTDKIGVTRDILDAALKQTKLEQLTAYVAEHEEDDNFNLSVEHLEFDKFLISAKKNENISADAYKLVAVGQYQEQIIIEETIFSWGLYNSTIFIDKFNLLKNKTIDVIIPVEEVNETEINDTFENETVFNETIVNITIINETKINETEINETVVNETIIINDTITNVTIISKRNVSIYREQSGRANTNEPMTVFFIINNNGDYIENLEIIDEIPQGWKVHSYPEGSIINNSIITLNIERINKNSITIINYEVIPYNEGAYTFSGLYSFSINNDNFNNIIINNDPYIVEVNNSKAAFEINTNISTNNNKNNNIFQIFSDKVEYNINFKIKNGNKKDVNKYDTYFRWILDGSWEIKLDNIGEDCNNKKINQIDGKKIIECSWPQFNKNEVKEFTITLKNDDEDFEELSRINITYDPPAIVLKESKNDPALGIDINATQFYEDLIVRFRHNSSDFETINVEGDINYRMDKYFSKGYEGVTLIVYNYSNEPFTINIGDRETIPLGKSSTFFDFSKEEEKGMRLITGYAIYTVNNKFSGIINLLNSIFRKTEPTITGQAIKELNYEPEIIESDTGKTVEEIPEQFVEEEPEEFYEDVTGKPIVKGETETETAESPSFVDNILEAIKIRRGSGGGGSSSGPTGAAVSAPEEKTFEPIWITSSKDIFLKTGNYSIVKYESSVKVSTFEINIKDSKQNKIDYESIIEKIKSETAEEMILDFNVEIKNKGINKIKFNNLKIKKNETFELNVEDASTDIESPVNVKWKKVYSIDPTNLDFTDAIVTSTAVGNELYKCRDWDFTTQTCFGSWEKLMDLIPGEEYSFTLTPEDPGYAEAGLATVNTNKSIYHLNEEAKIIMVVLDKFGYLVSNADVVLNVTDPNNITSIYSTSDGAITETERGIYTSTYTDTSLEGNYSMFVRAIGNNVNNSMFSYFIVKDYYEFDILRTTPVTTDPWQGPFESSIKIISFTDATIFDFSEVLPINFTIINNNNSIITEKNNKKILTWQNLANGSVVSYSVLPPLVTPELYEIGPSYVNYDSNTFTEARPWYLAVDPVFVTTNEAHDIDIAILDDETGMFVIAWCDDTDDSARYQVFYSNTTAYRALNEFDTAAGDSCRIAVTALNSTAFVIAYVDWVGGKSPSSDWTIVGYDIDNNVIRSLVDIDADTYEYVDVGVCALNGSRYASVYMDDYDNDATYVVYDMATQIIGQTDLDTAADPSNYDTQFVDCGAVSSNSWVFAYYDDSSDENAFAMYDAAGTETKSRTTIGASSGDGAVAVSGLANGGFVIAYCDDTDDDISFTTYDSSGNSVSVETDVDESITGCGGADNTMVEVSALNTVDGRFTVIYDDTTADEVYIAVYNYSGDQILAPQKLDDTDTTEKAVAVAGYDSIQQKTVCKYVTDPIIVAYNNQTGPNAVWVSYYADGSVWDGICEDAPPNVTLEYPPAGYWNDTSDPYSINFNCSITDDNNATNISLYLTDNQNTSFAFNDSCNIPVSDINGSCNWTKSLANGNYTWNCLGYDNAAQSDWDVNRTILINFTGDNPPTVTLNSPINNYNTSSYSITFNCTASDDNNLTNVTLYGNWTGWHANETNSSGFSGADYIFNKTIAGEGLYIWNCYACDNLSNCSFASSNSTFTIDTTSPSITINNPTNTVRDPSPTINISFNENVITAWYNIDEGENTTLCANCDAHNNSFVNLKEGPYTIYAYANDSAGNVGSNSSSFTLDFDGNYYENFDDNSSLVTINYADWVVGKVSYNGTKNTLYDLNFYDTFPSTTLNTTNWPATNNNPTVLNPASAGEPSSPYALELANTDAVQSKAIDTTQTTSVNISWYYVQQCQSNDPEVGELIYVYYNNSDGNWVQLWSLDGGIDTAWHFANFTLTSNIKHENFKVRINTTSSSGDDFDQYCVDDVKVTITEVNRGNFTSEWINTTENKTYVIPVWNTNNTDVANNITIQISTDNGSSWCNATNNTRINSSSCANFFNNTDLIYQAIFSADSTTIIELLDINFTWAALARAPVISNILPANNSLVKDPVTLSCDTDETADCKYSTTETFIYNTSGTLFSTTGSTSHSSSLGSLGEGTYTYYIKCNDTEGNYNNDSNQGSTTFTVDNTAPNVTLNYPLGIFVPDIVNFNWTVIDNFDNNLSCNLTIDGVVNQSDIVSLNGTSTNSTVSNFSSGVYYWNVTCWDDPGNFNTSVTANFTVDNDPPTFSNINLSIHDFKTNTTGAVTRTLNISDNSSDVNNNSIKLWFSNTYPPWKYIEGVAQPTWQYLNYTLVSNNGNSSYYVNFTWEDDDVYRPGTFNLDPDLVDTGAHTNYSVYKNTYLRVNFTNFYATKNTTYSIEFVAEPNEDATNSLNIYYCNNSYSTGDVRTAESCVIVRTEEILGTAEHEEYRTAKFAGDKYGKIAGIFATNDSSVVFECWACANARKGWSVRATADAITSSYSSTDGGDSWDIISADELDVHMHWFLHITNETTCQAILYQTEAADLASPANIVNETQTSDPWRPDNNPPTVPIVQAPAENQLVNGVFNITWQSSVDPEGDPFDYNVTLLFTNETIVQIINGSTTLNYVLFNFSTVNEGSYLVRVEACDNLGSCSLDNTYTFFVDETSPSITLNYPVNGSNITNSPINFNWTVIDNFGNNLTCNITIDGIVEASDITSLNGTFTNYTISVIDGTRNWNVTCWDNATNVNTSETRSFSYSIIKSILSVQTINKSYKQNKDVNLSNSIKNISEDQESGAQKIEGGIFYTPEIDLTTKTCDNIWGFDCGASVAGEPGGDGDNTFDSCLESDLGDSSFSHVEDVSVNVTHVKPGDSVLVTCTFDPGQSDDSEYIWYYNGTGESTVQANWELLYSGTSSSSSQESQSVTITADNVVGKHWVRCIIDYSGENDICADGGNSHDNDDVNFTVALISNYTGDGNSSFVEYTDIGASNYTKLSDFDIIVEIDHYNASGSIEESNTYPDLEVQVYDGSSYSYNYFCNLNITYAGGGGNFNHNCSKKIVNSTLLSNWVDTTNRKIKIRAVYLDNQNGINDTINWTGAWVEFETPSKLENYGNANLSGTLLIQIINSTGDIIETVYNQSQTIQYNSTLNLSNLGVSWNTNSYNLGTYKIYAALLNSSGSAIQTYDGTYINDTYEFSLDYLRIAVQSPLNNSIQDATNFWANVTLQYTSYPSSGWCAYSLDGAPNITMVNDSGIHFFNFTKNTFEGQHNITFYCNDTDGDVSVSNIVIFNATDQTPPIVNLISPADGGEEADGDIAFVYNATDIASNISNCTFEFQFEDNWTNSTIIENTRQNFTITGLANGGPYYWRVRCTDNSSNSNEGNSSYRDFIVGQDTDEPIITLKSPIDGYNTSNNDVFFEYRVNDITSGIANCSLIINNQTNQTNTSIVEQGGFPYNFNNFTVHDMPDANYTWSVNCTDTSNNANIGNSSTRILTVNRDLDFPIITLISPANNSVDTDGDLIFQYNVTDASSNIANCSLIINGTINTTTLNPTKDQTNSFTVNNFDDGVYNWQVNCTDDSFDLNRNSSEMRYFNVTEIQVMKASVGTDKATYEQGTQANDTIIVTANTTDDFNNPVDSNVITDIIQKNTTLRWWNSSWERRKPIFINETRGENRSEELIQVNITGLGDYIQDCTNEIRIIKNNSLTLTEINISVRDGDDSTWCLIRFWANISANAVNENNYYVYYNYSGAPDPSYSLKSESYNTALFFESFESGWDMRSDSNPNTGCSGGYGNFNNCDDTYAPSPDYQFAATNDDNVDSVYPITGSYINVMDYWVTWESTRGIWYSFDATTACDGACGDIRVTGYVAAAALDTGDFCRAWARNTTGFNYITIGECSNGEACESATANDGPDALSDYELFNKTLVGDLSYGLSSYTAIHIGADTGLTSDNNDCYFEDIRIEGLRNYTYNVTSSVGQTQVLIDNNVSDTGSDGTLTFNLSTNGLEQDWYSVISFATASNYNDAFNYTNFEIVTDQTAPTINLISPTAGATNDTANVTFYYNVSDSLSGIKNCSIIINGTINQTDVSISEDTRLNFSMENMSNKDYLWNINCTDDSANENTGEGTARVLTIAVDTTAPVVTLLNPQNNYTDTNRNVSFNYSVSDDLTSTADCSLYINNTLNTTQLDVPTDGSAQTIDNLTLFNNNSYNWYVNCTDDSIARNFNISETRNFTVIEDLEGPVIDLKFPANGAHLTNDDINFTYNVSDTTINVSVSSCSLSINGTLNQTNLTITEGILNNFSVFNFDNGFYNWSVNCTDTSENANVKVSEVRTFRVAPDNDPPIVKLEFPPNNIELNPSDESGNITFKYNVSDLASDILNCSIYINGTLNLTDTTITEDTSQNFSVNISDEGFYTWYVNCTDDSGNFNFNKSETRNLTIGTDQTPPEVTLEAPVDGYNDTNGVIFFEYNVEDIANPIKNCSLIINSTINQTNTSVTEIITNNFTASGFNNGTYLWQVNCTDNSSGANVGNSSTRIFNVKIDEAPPIIKLVSPDNNTLDSDGNLIFYYNATDDISGIDNCSLIINNLVNLTNNTITGSTRLNFTVNGFDDGDYNWSVNCTDSSENLNVGASAFRNFTVSADNTGPVVTLQGPPDNSTDTNGNVTFNYTVTDAKSGIANCTLKVGSQEYTDDTITESITQQFNITDLTTADYYWNVTCNDDSDNGNSVTSESWNISIIIDNAAPVINLVTPLNNTQEVINNVTFIYNVSDTVPIGNCSIYINGTYNMSNQSSVIRDTRLNFTLYNMTSGVYQWEINCTDTSEDKFIGSSEERIVIIGPDIVAPTVTLISPANGIQDTDGNLLFEYNVTDFASTIANCSLIINGTLNKTNHSIQEDTTQSFRLFDVSNDDYSWQVNCTDNSSNLNVGASEIRNITVGKDTTPPDVTYVSPANNTIVNSEDVTFTYTANDYASNITNCSLYINNKLNITNSTISETTSNFFYLYNVPDGDYNWSINCTDYYNNSNLAPLPYFNFSIFSPKQIIADIYTNDTSYEQGNLALITVNVTNSSENPFNSDIYIDIIKGNTTVPFFDSNWAYRIPVDINTTNITRKDILIEFEVNFTDVLVSDLEISGKTFDMNSIRVMEWENNKSVEVIYQFKNGSNFNPVNNSYGTVSWILNGTTSNNTIRNYFIYFDVEENGNKEAVDYSSYEPSFTFTGSKRNVLKDGTSNNADYVRIYKGAESITLQFANGQDISNQQNIDYQGAGSIWNITLDSARISNYYDSIIPVAIYNNYFLNQNGTANITSGPVYSKIRIPGYLNGTAGTDADLNYTLWYGSNEIMIKADLYVKFNSANNDPLSLFNNLWFAYLLDYESDWSSFINVMNSTSFDHTHQYHAPNVEDDTTNQFNTGDWYSEYDSNKGSINLYVKKFTLNDVAPTKGSVSLDDYYNPAEPKTTESDGVGFNLNSDQTIAAGDSYSLTIWMILSNNNSSLRAIDLKNYVDYPVNITQKKGQELINRTINVSDSDGIFRFNWSTANKDVGNYTATIIANKTLYTLGVDYYRFEITFDVTKPIVTSISPEGFINTENTTFTYNVSDANNISNCSLIINNVVNITNSSVINNAQNTIILYNMSEGFYNWSVNCSDAAGNVGNSSIKNITVDLTEPGISLLFPADSATLNYTNLQFNFTAVDNFDDIMLCNVTIDGAVESTLNATNNSITIANITVSAGSHKWNVTCNDDAGNVNTSLTRTVIIDVGAPEITLNSPENNSFSAVENLTLVYTPSSLTLANCSLVIDGFVNQTDSNPTTDVENTFTLENRSEGKLQWSVNCSDDDDDIGHSGTFNIFVDFTKPNVTLLAPEDGYLANDSNLQFNFTVRDNVDSILECNVTINGTVNNTQIINAANNTVVDYNTTSLTDGLFFWNATCKDSANHTNTSLTWNFTVQDPPNILLGNPVNATRTKNRNQTFYFTPSDNSGNLSNCTVVLNNKLNETNTSINNGVENNIPIRNLSDNAYNWTVNCTDPSGNVGTNETTKVIYIDNLGPSIILNSPLNGSNFTVNDINFNFTPTDQFGLNISLTCNITLDGAVNVSGISVISGETNVTLINDLADGNHTWNVTCLDDLNNSNISLTNIFKILKPDLTLTIDNIIFNNTEPIEGDNVTINATISNIGGVAANNVLVRVYDGNPLLGGTQIDTDRTVSSIDSGENATVNVTWEALLGLHEIFVSADPLNSINEEIETNNNASKNITISLWHIVTGNITGNLILQSIGNKTVFSWNVSGATSGNIFVIDSDSSVTWTNLTALGRNISGGNASDDWGELDIQLNTSNATKFQDSVNITFLSNHVPKNITSFVVFKNTIYNVSIVNSTNNTNFVTGILWDQSDDESGTGNGEYNGSEDVVFITEIQRNKQGRYGNYDFEMKVPAKLRDYVQPNNDNSVSFYVELK